MAAVRVTGFDHVVLRVGDVERSLDWYTGALGLTPVRVDQWRRGEAPFPSIRVNASTIIDLIPRRGGDGPVPHEVLDHFCLVVEPCDFGALADAFTVVDGPAQRFGAQGVATSLYVEDPDRTIVELRYYDR
jgi:catechol 2,3-dioxygenase-like lactoylglutathione lyase family enzyme